MPSGGARARSGPAPDPLALRRDRKDDQATWTHLPPEGRTAEPPYFPLPSATDRERELWVYVWSLPQAVEWERGRYLLTVANYVRVQALSESPLAETPVRSLVKQYETSLGLNTEGLARNRWKIDEEAPSDARHTSTRPVNPQRASRLRAIEGGAA